MLAPADFHLKPSRLYMLIFGVMVLVTLLVLVTLAIPLWLKLLAIAIVIAYSAHVYRRHVLLNDKLSITTIRYTSDKRWVLQNREGTYAVNLHPGTTVTTFIILLHFRVPGKMLPMKSVIFRDSLPQDDFRKLLVILSA